MLNSGKKILTLKNHNPPPPFQVKWSVPYSVDTCNLKLA